jgi:hypothetical protein
LSKPDGIELYHHTVRAGQYDEACDLFYQRLNKATYHQLGACRRAAPKRSTGILERKYGGVVAGQFDLMVNFPN